MEYIAIASTLVSAYGQYSAGQSQKAMYESQAIWQKIQGESEALAYEKAGNDALTKTLRTLSTINARAAAGNLNPFSGTPMNLQSYALRKGFEEFSTAVDSADIKRKTAAYQAGLYRTAGKQAYRTGIFNAFGQVGQGYMMYKAIAPSGTINGAGTGTTGFNPQSSGGQGPIFGYS